MTAKIFQKLWARAFLALMLLVPYAAYAQTFNTTPVVSAAAESCHVLKASPGNLIAANAVNLTATAGFLIVLNSATVPADGAVLPLEVQPIAANAVANIPLSAFALDAFSTGIVICITSAATPFTKTTGTATGFFHAVVQ